MRFELPLLTNIGFLATCRAEGGQSDIHVIRDAALAWEGDRITWVGAASDLPGAMRDAPAQDAGGRMVLPGLVDCHTHLAFGGWRADEFEQRLQGATYLDIAARGGGIASTVRRTRAASEADLMARATGWLTSMRQLGVTTVECKSGYGLDRETELRLLRVYRALAVSRPITDHRHLPGCPRRPGGVSRAARRVCPVPDRRNDPRHCGGAAGELL